MYNAARSYNGKFGCNTARLLPEFGGWVDVADGKTNEDASHISKVGTSPFGSLSYFDALAILRSRWPVS